MKMPLILTKKCKLTKTNYLKCTLLYTTQSFEFFFCLYIHGIRIAEPILSEKYSEKDFQMNTKI